MFTSTTCPPCVSANAAMNTWYPDNDDISALIRYHVWWPSPGNDPFYLANTAEAQARTNYYGVNGVPDIFADGLLDASFPPISQVAQRRAVDPPVDIMVAGSYDVDNNVGEATITVSALEDFNYNDLRFFFVITEDNCVYTGTNGDPVHHQVMRDMVPNANGESFDIADGESVVFTRSFSLSPVPGVNETGIPENTNVVCWVQDVATNSREVHQAAWVPLMELVPAAAIEGYVTDCANEEGLDVTNVYVEGTGYATITDENGFYHLNAEPGTHTVVFERFGYVTHTQEVTLAEDDLLPVDVCLNAFGQSTLTGTVSQRENGNPIPNAPIELLGVPINSTVTDENGVYTFSVPGGYTYEVSVYADDREPVVESVTVPENEVVEHNFPMRFVQSFEATDGGFDPNRLWEWGDANAGGGAETAYLGMKYWSTNIDGAYPSNQRADLVTPEYSLTQANAADLFYAHWLDTNEGWDGYNLSISTNGGDDWVRIEPEGGYPGSVIGLSGQPGFSSDSNVWEMVHYDLTDYLGEVVQFRFRFGSTNNNRNYLGVCIDYFDLQTDVETAVDEPQMTGIAIPQALTLSQNVPNPFNPNTKIHFALPQTQHINVAIYALNGQLVKTLQNGVLSAGDYTVTWNGTNEQGVPVASGTYIYRLESNAEILSKTMVLLK